MKNHTSFNFTSFLLLEMNDTTSIADSVVVIFKLIIGFIILFVNTCIICIYCSRNRKLLKILPNRLLLSLSICELQTGISVVLNSICDIYKTKLLVIRILSDIYTTVLVETFVLHLCGITLDRYLSLFYAMTYQTIVTKRTIKMVLMFAWGIPLTIGLLQFIWLHKILGGEKDISAMAFISGIEVCYSIVTFILFVTVPMILLGIAFYAMIHEIRRLMRCIPDHHKCDQLPRKRRVIYIFCSIYVSYVVLAMPYFALRLSVDIQYWKVRQIKVCRPVVHFVIVLKNVASIVNPILYASTARGLRSLLKRVVKKFPSRDGSFNTAHNQSVSTVKSLVTSHKEYPATDL